MRLFLFSILAFPIDPTCAAAECGPSDANALHRFLHPVPVEIRNLPLGSGGEPLSTEEPFVSPDGQFLFFNSHESEGNKDLYFAKRSGSRWIFQAKLESDEVQINNDKEVQGNPSMDSGNEFFYVDSGTDAMVQRAKFDTLSGKLYAVSDVVGLPKKDVRLFSQEVSGTMGVEISADGSQMFFDRAVWKLRMIWPSMVAASDIAVAFRERDRFRYDERESERQLGRLNTKDLEYAESISADLLEIFFTRLKIQDLSEKQFRSVILYSWRGSSDDAFRDPVVLSAIGCSDFVEAPALSPDGRELYYHKLVGNKFRVFKVTRAQPSSSPIGTR